MGKYKLYLNNMDEYVDILTDDPLLFDRFAEGRGRIMDMVAVLIRKHKKIEREYRKRGWERTVALVRANAGFSKEAVKIMNGVFGEETIEKYFRKIYEEYSDFTPGVECFMDFFEKVTPVMERLFDRKINDGNTIYKEERN